MTPPRVGGYEIAGELRRDGRAVYCPGTDTVIRRPAILEVVRKRALAPADAARAVARLPSVIEDMLAALDHAHSCGVVHRALRPELVFVSATGTAKIGGFGVACADGADFGPQAHGEAADEALRVRRAATVRRRRRRRARGPVFGGGDRLRSAHRTAAVCLDGRSAAR